MESKVFFRFAAFTALGGVIGLASGAAIWIVLSLMGYPRVAGLYVFIVFLATCTFVSVFRNWRLIVGRGQANTEP